MKIHTDPMNFSCFLVNITMNPYEKAEPMPSHCGMAWSDAKAARHWPGPSHALMALVAYHGDLTGVGV